MRAFARWLPAVVLAVTVCGAAIGQDSESEKDAKKAYTPKESGVFAEVTAWFAQPSGLGLTPATETGDGTGADTHPLSVDLGTANRMRTRIGYRLPHGLGEFVLTWFAHEDTRTFERLSPSDFVYGEILAHPVFAGTFDDGLADGFSSDILVRMRDLRIDYYRDAFSSPRIRGKWYVGYRRVSLQRNIDALYYSLAPNLPAILDPLTNGPKPGLDPLPDFARVRSEFSARGAEAGLEVEMPVLRRFRIEAGLGVAALRGRMSSEYASTTHTYAIDENGTLIFVEPPFDLLGEFIDPQNPELGAWVDRAVQESFGIGYSSNNESANSFAVETYLGFRWRVWRDLDLVGGFRTATFGNVGLELRPKNVTLNPNGSYNVQDVTRTTYDVNFEGYYAGVAYVY